MLEQLEWQYCNVQALCLACEFKLFKNNILHIYMTDRRGGGWAVHLVLFDIIYFIVSSIFIFDVI